jgi:hypothetical protein
LVDLPPSGDFRATTNARVAISVFGAISTRNNQSKALIEEVRGGGLMIAKENGVFSVGRNF